MKLRPSSRISLAPFGLRQTKPRHYREMIRVAWENRDELPFAWRILTRGVCDGCALGTSGLSDWTIEGIHLCIVRLELLRLNTMPALDPQRLNDVAPLASLPSRALRELGRLPEPMVRRRGEKGFRVVCWEEALDLAAGRLRECDPNRAAFYLTSRGIPNETYYVAQPKRDLLRRTEGGPLPRVEPRGQLGPLLPRRLDCRHEEDAGARRVDHELPRLDRVRPDRLLRSEHPQQPAGHDEVPPRGEEGRRANRRRQPVPGAGAGPLLGSFGPGERPLRHEARRPLVRGGHGRGPRVCKRRLQGAAGRAGRDRRELCADSHGGLR